MDGTQTEVAPNRAATEGGTRGTLFLPEEYGDLVRLDVWRLLRLLSGELPHGGLQENLQSRRRIESTVEPGSKVQRKLTLQAG